MKVLDVVYYPCPKCDKAMAIIDSDRNLGCFTCGAEAPAGSVQPLTAKEIDREPMETYVARLRALQREGE